MGRASIREQATVDRQDPLFEVANHSYSHYAFTDDCYGLPTVPEDGCGRTWSGRTRPSGRRGCADAMPYFRFPGGCYDQRALQALSAAGVTAVQWDVVSGDAFATDADAVARQVLRGAARVGASSCLHAQRGSGDRAGAADDRSRAARAGASGS